MEMRVVGLRARVNIIEVIGVGMLASVLAAGIWPWTPDRSRADLEARYLDASTTVTDVIGTPLRVRDSHQRLSQRCLGVGQGATWPERFRRHPRDNQRQRAARCRAGYHGCQWLRRCIAARTDLAH
jgi:hypothetical protein